MSDCTAEDSNPSDGTIQNEESLTRDDSNAQNFSDVEVGTPSKMAIKITNRNTNCNFTENDVKDISHHWQKWRSKWLKQKYNKDDVRENLDYSPIPNELKEREVIKNILRNKVTPWRAFDYYYDLTDIIELFREMWFDDEPEF